MPLYSRDEAMQNTFREWQDSVHAEVGTQCQDCHMPWKTAANGRRYRSHAFPGGRDPAMIARAIQLSVRVEPTRDAVVLHANVSAGMTGHAFPTGDLFRRGELTVWIEGEPSLSRTVSFARDFADVMERAPGTHAITFVRHQVGDSRLPAPGTGAPAEYTLTVPVPASAWRPEMRVRWAVDHLLMPSPMAASQGVGTARNRVRVLEGSAVVTRPGEAP
jgi:hypothetical protein